MENPEFTESSCLGCGFFFQSALALVPLIPTCNVPMSLA